MGVLTMSQCRFLQVSEHVSIQFLNPIFLLLFSWPVLGEIPTKVEVAAVLLALLGTLMIVR